MRSTLPIRHASCYTLLAILCVGLAAPAAPALAAEPAKPLKILLITGGCCHDYAAQKLTIARGLQDRANANVTYVEQGDGKRETKLPIYENADWSKGYDLVIHDECSGGATDVDWSERVLAPHKKGLPAVIIHCGVHCFRNGTDNWHEFVGVTSFKHGRLYPHEVTNRDREHPIMKNFPAVWDNPAGELYWIEKVWPTAHVLAVAENQENANEEACIWTNEYHGARVFGTTLGHRNQTVESSEFLDVIARGSLWACDKLNEDYLKPAGAGK